MSIGSEVNRIKNNILNSYNEISNKGGDMPSVLNSANLSNAIASIISGGMEIETGDSIVSFLNTSSGGSYIYLDRNSNKLSIVNKSFSSSDYSFNYLNYNDASIICCMYLGCFQTLIGINFQDNPNAFRRTVYMGSSMPFYSITTPAEVNNIMARFRAICGYSFRKLKVAGDSVFVANFTNSSTLNSIPYNQDYSNQDFIFPSLEVVGNNWLTNTGTTGYNIFVSVDYKRLKKSGNYFLQNATFKGNNLYIDLDSLEVAGTYWLYSTATGVNGQLFQGSGCKISFGKGFILASTHTSFIDRAVNQTNAFTLEFRGVQTLTTAPTNFLRTITTNTMVHLRIREGSAGVNVASKTWLGKTWLSITLIDENGNAI